VKWYESVGVMALFTLFSVILAAVASSAAQHVPGDYPINDWGYPPDQYPPAKPVYEPEPPTVYPPEPEPPSVPEPPAPYPPDSTGTYPPEPDPYVPEPVPPGPIGYGPISVWHYGDPFKKLRDDVLHRIQKQKEKIDAIIEFRDMTIVSIDKISTLSAAWCRSK